MRRHAVTLLVLLLAACGSVPQRSPAPAPGGTGAAPSAAPGLGSGRYYKDDGPGENPPANLDAVPDAVPRIEALHRFANRPYTVLGREYIPATSLKAYRERGIASWYGRKFHGQKTSIGEPYDMYAMTAAHPTLPLPSYARVTNVANGRSVIVRVNDRGPFLHDRLIDLSYAAAYRLGIAQAGSGEVEVESILPGAAPPPVVLASVPGAGHRGAVPSGTARVTSVSAVPVRDEVAATPLATAAVTPPLATAAVTPLATAAATAPLAIAAVPVAQALPVASSPSAQAPPVASSALPQPVPESRGVLPPVADAPVVSPPADIALVQPRPAIPAASTPASGYAVQLGAFASYPNALDFLAHVQNQLAGAKVEARVRQAGGLYRVYVGPYADRDEARRVGERITQAFGFATLVAPQAAR